MDAQVRYSPDAVRVLSSKGPNSYLEPISGPLSNLIHSIHFRCASRVGPSISVFLVSKVSSNDLEEEDWAIEREKRRAPVSGSVGPKATGPESMMREATPLKVLFLALGKFLNIYIHQNG